MKKKVIFLLPSLRAGGAEKVISFVARRLGREYYDPELHVLGYEKDAAYDTGTLEVTFLNRPRLLHAIPSIISLMIRRKPDIVVGSISHINILLGILSLFFRDTVFIGREASVFSVMNEFSGSSGRMYRTLLRFSYRRLSSVICQSADIRDDLEKGFGIEPSKLAVINNPVTFPPPLREKEIDCCRPEFITVGRLSREKGHERVLRSLAGADSCDFRYTIIGSGPLRGEILDLIERLQLQEKVELIDYSDDIAGEISRHDFYLQGSYVEGFPNALLESCSTGTPFIAFDAPGGTREIFIEGVNGYLAGSEEEFTAVLQDADRLKMISDPEAVRNSVIERFRAGRIMHLYESLFRDVSAF